MKTLLSSTVIATVFAFAATADGHSTTAATSEPNFQIRALEDATLYVTGHGDDAASAASTNDLTELGESQRIVYDDEGRPVAVLLDIGGLKDTASYEIAVSVADLVALPSKTTEPRFRIDLPMAEIMTMPRFAGDPGTAPRTEQAEDLQIQETGVTTQAGPENKTEDGMGKALTDAREPIGGSLDVQERVVDQGTESD